MIGKKELLAQALYRAGVLSLLSRMPAMGSSELRILAYHRVFDVADESAFPYDLELISASIANFRKQMEYVAKFFVPVTCHDVLTALDGGRPLPRRAVVITFDDGHSDNYTNAFPVLQSLGVPATVFLSTAYIGSAGTFWFDQITYVLFRASAGLLTIPGIKTSLNLSDASSRRQAADIVREHLKSLPDEKRRTLIDHIIGMLGGVNVNSIDVGLSGAMTWDQVREMSRAGIEFGSHAVSHPILAQLDDAALERELVESRLAIEKIVGRPVNIIAYPDGGTSAFDERVIAAVKRAGYQLGLAYIPGSNNLNRFNRFAGQRLHIERYTTHARFRAMLELPRLFAT